jgi:hypothetical protein
MRDRGENQLERRVAQPPLTGRTTEAGEGHQTEAERHRETGEETKVHGEGGSLENMQSNKHSDKSTKEPESRSATFGEETATSRPDHTSMSAATPAGNIIPSHSLLSLQASSLVPPRDDTSSSATGAEGAAASSIPPLWDGSNRHSPIQRPISLPPPARPVLLHTASPSQLHRRHQSEISSQQALGVVSVVSAQVESPTPSVRLRAHLSSESLSTSSSVSLSSDEEGNEDLSTIDSESVGSTWAGTIIDMECKSAKAKGGRRVFFQAKLDTAARRDVLAEKIVDRLGIRVRHDRKGKTFKVVGDRAGAETIIKPLGYVMLKLRGVGREQNLKLKFYVLADSDVGQTFDCLLGCATSRIYFLALREDGILREYGKGPAL